MTFENLSDCMKSMILAKLDVWTAVELHACSRQVARFVEKHYEKDVDRKRLIEKISFKGAQKGTFNMGLMSFENLSDDMKLAILAKLDVWTVVELRACSRQVARFVERYYNKHVERKRLIEEITFDETKVRWSFHTLEDTIDETVDRIQGMYVEKLKIEKKEDLEKIKAFCVRSNVTVRTLILDFTKLRAEEMIELLSVIRPVALVMVMGWLSLDYWKEIKNVIPVSIRELALRHSDDDYIHPRPPISHIPPHIHSLFSNFEISYSEINNIIKSWQRGERKIKQYELRPPGLLMEVADANAIFNGTGYRVRNKTMADADKVSILVHSDFYPIASRLHIVRS